MLMSRACKGLLLLPLAIAAAPALADDPSLPARRAGLWETQTTVMGMSSTVRQCVAAGDPDFTQKLTGNRSNDCSELDVKKVGQEVRILAVCQSNGHEIRTVGTLSGDFQAAYEGKLNVTVNPPMNGIGSSDVTLSARWTGACNDTQNTVVVPGQQSIDLNDPKVREMLRNLKQQLLKQP